jgi:hypothetical protein
MGHMRCRVLECYVDGKLDFNVEFLLVSHVRFCHLLLRIIEGLAKEVKPNNSTELQPKIELGCDRQDLPPYWEILWGSMVKALRMCYEKRAWEVKYMSRKWHDPDYKPETPEQIFDEGRVVAQECLDKMAQLDRDWPCIPGTENSPSMFPPELTEYLKKFTEPCPPRPSELAPSTSASPTPTPSTSTPSAPTSESTPTSTPSTSAIPTSTPPDSSAAPKT